LIFTALAAIGRSHAGDKKSPRPEEAAKGFKDWNAFEASQNQAIVGNHQILDKKAAGGESRA
jgi:hypothetical protein